MKFKLLSNMEIQYNEEYVWKTVDIKACFPLKNSNRFLSVLNSEGQEVELITSLDELTNEDKVLVQKYLHFKEYSFEILGVYEVKDEFAVRTFFVKTNSGDLKFQTELDHWPELVGEKTHLLQDLFGDRYLIQDLEFGYDKIQALIN